MSLVAQRPQLSPEDAARIAAAAFALEVEESIELESERDRNFRLETPGGRFVLKVANPAEERAFLECQNEALARLAAAGCPVPRVRPAAGGAALAEHEDAAGQTCFVRLLTWLEGTPLARFQPHTPALLEEIGRTLGRADRAFDGWAPPAADRPFHWDLRNVPALLVDHLAGDDTTTGREILARILEIFEEQLLQGASELPTALLHNDANDYNLLVVAEPAGPPRLTGLLDLGDLAWSWRAAEPAIAAAYAMLDKRDPLAAACTVLAGYHREQPLEDREVDAVYPLLLLRLAASAIHAAAQRAAAPEHAYLSVSEKPVWRLLERLHELHPRLARARLRAACGLAAHPQGARFRAWTAAHAASAVSPLPDAYSLSEPLLLDLSVSGADGLTPAGDPPDAWERRLARRLEACGARLAWGRWGEPRLCYEGEMFAAEGEEHPERRTVHLGVDLFAPAGTPVRAPLAGTVHSVRDNDGPLDYGPTVILEHEPEPGLRFWTLFGHLGRESIAALEPGTALEAGASFAALGARAENGGWAPHLHYQVVLDLLGCEGEFPGVAAPGAAEAWLGLCPDSGLLLGRPDSRLRPHSPPKHELRAARRARLGPSLSLAYREPLHIVRGQGAWLFDDRGRAFLDCVNNVCHVGHAHPRVVQAAAEQMALLNTNTRYLHELRLRYAERLASTLPDPLDVVFLVCTGSEANDLAVRMARTATGGEDLVVLEAGYHGHTQTLIDASSYKHDGPGGGGAPDWVHAVPLPDPYRGRHRGPGSGPAYAAHVQEVLAALEQQDRRAAAFLAEALPGCGGQVVLPAGYLRAAYAAVRAAGGVCIADEVQTGFGRVGDRFWAFELQDAVPDLVTLGKPIGNGHPLAAVVATREVADAFDTGMEYFNTFGGNPVSCAVGLAVLDVIEEERLQERARDVGTRLLHGLRELQERHALIGDVRGHGLFLGVELVSDREQRTPAPKHAACVVERMKAHGILLSTDGPQHDVLKIKPPLVFSDADADRLLTVLDRVLSEDALQPAV